MAVLRPIPKPSVTKMTDDTRGVARMERSPARTSEAHARARSGSVHGRRVLWSRRSRITVERRLAQVRTQKAARARAPARRTTLLTCEVAYLVPVLPAEFLRRQ